MACRRDAAGRGAHRARRHDRGRGPPALRPPLSKEHLAGKWGMERVFIRPPEKIAALGLDLRLGRSATSLDVEGHRLGLDDGTTISFDGLVLATGARPRVLPGTESISGVHTLRTLEDCHDLAAATADPGTRLVVVGAGFIGAEVAATCHGRGASVTVLESLPVPLARVLGEEMGALCADLHAANGVEIRTGTDVAGLRTRSDGAGGRVTGVELADGTVVPADVVVVGIGVEPNTAWLEGSGLEVGNGVVADATLHVADDVVAAGDVVRWFDESLGTDIRIEHWTNAAEQGVHAARSLSAGRVAALP
ncbi:MAG: NAD(P)/FAD-dependent oxidoreductase, partial [Acidimicrobiales bacterium]